MYGLRLGKVTTVETFGLSDVMKFNLNTRQNQKNSKIMISMVLVVVDMPTKMLQQRDGMGTTGPFKSN